MKEPLRAFQERFVRRALAPGIDVAGLSIPRGNGKSWLAAHLHPGALDTSGSRTGGLITMSGRRTEVNKHQIRWSLTKTHKDLSTRCWLLERACEPDQVPARPGPGLIPRPEHQAPKDRGAEIPTHKSAFTLLSERETTPFSP